ncbi:MAG TPA: bifunctional demethylmenaquinone methyltransferase/2-methoxy-6-polyprenyl-1,4-benzoquinol methylase UbiE [Salinivirgaceae bacterium]|nr:bifunctional demethylmenaquinone methyltransferase/2-methoxy-6-polyprenyl-1,4-benzoquinol methylase UbiE [Salinivirgaceae bacterium]
MNQSADNHNQKIQSMFDSISLRYDLLNRLLSLGIDGYWRRKVVSIVRQQSSPSKILDLATGTGDLAILLARKNPSSTITAVDLSPKMLERARTKISRKKLEHRIEIYVGDGQNLSFEENTFDAATIAFGIRNYASPQKGVEEIFRTLKAGGVIAILEFDSPSNRFFASIFRFYFHKLVPTIGRIISGNSYAYHYLPESVNNFSKKIDLYKVLDSIGFEDIRQTSLTFGVAKILSAKKPK